jgi:hypothetical protein
VSNWELWAKRVVKGIIWMIALLTIAWALEIDPTWRVMLLVLTCSLIDDILRIALPTNETAANKRAGG